MAPRLPDSSSEEAIPLRRPTVHYENGDRMDASGSSSPDAEEQERLLTMPVGMNTFKDDPLQPGTPSIAEAAEWGSSPRNNKLSQQTSFSRINRRRNLRLLLIALGALVGCAVVTGVVTGWWYRGGSTYVFPGTKKIEMDHIFNGTFYARRDSVRWVAEAGDGVYAIQEQGKIWLVHLETDETKVLVDEENIKDPRNPDTRLPFAKWQLSPTTEYLLLKAENRKQWRHSSIGRHFIHHIASSKTYPIFSTDDEKDADEAYAEFLPSGDGIVLVRGGDLFVSWLPTSGSPSPPTEITHSSTTRNSSTTTFFSGVPDWVYEEEVFSSEKGFWSAPLPENETSTDKHLLAYLTLNSSQVDTYTYPIYNPTSDPNYVDSYLYPEDGTIPYPKPGRNNPVAGVSVVALSPDETSHPISLNWPDRFGQDDSVLQDVAWLSPFELLVKEVNRAANDGHVVYFNFEGVDWSAGIETMEGKVVRRLGREGEEGDDGWIDCTQNVVPLPKSLAQTLTVASDSAYLDIVPTKDGYNHIALFSPAFSSDPIFLTHGSWEVSDAILGVSHSDGAVYFRAARPSSVDRNVFSVKLPMLGAVLDTDGGETRVGEGNVRVLSELENGDEGAGYWDASFSPRAGWYMLSYMGPAVPRQEIRSTSNQGYTKLLEQNGALKNATRAFEMAKVEFGTVSINGFDLNYKQLTPPRFSSSGTTKYPVLFQVYGGPGSQLVSRAFGVSWHEYLVTRLGYVVVIVDGRGTGFNGRKMRNAVRGKLGVEEGVDQIAAAKVWASKGWVDKGRIGIWGWSYGGFQSSKVAEMNAGVHSLVMSIAPVTSWRLYDSIYTERYMDTPAANPDGYKESGIHNVTGFGNVDYLFAHGSADDNVHYANSARLLDMLTTEGIRGWRFRMFTDSDHSISRRGAYREVFEFMLEFLLEKWGSRTHGRGRGA